MSITFRVTLIIVSILSAGYTFRKIRKSQMLISGAIYWLFLSIGFIILSAFPQIAIVGAHILGIISPANFVFLIVLFIIIIKLFTLSIDISILKTKLTLLIEEYAIRTFEQERKAEESIKLMSKYK